MTIKKTTKYIGSVLALSLTSNAAVIIDSSFANGNGSFEFDSAGNVLAASGAPGKWVTNGDTALTIDGSDSIAAIDTVFANTVVSSDGSYSLVVNPDPNSNVTNRGGILNTAYVVGASDQFSFSFDWQKTDNALGAATFEVFVFTSSDNTLGGTLTSLYKSPFGSGPAMTAFDSVNLTPGDFTVAGANVGQELFVAFAAGGFSGASNSSELNIDNLNLSVVPEPSSSALFAIALGGLAFRRRRV